MFNFNFLYLQKNFLNYDFEKILFVWFLFLFLYLKKKVLHMCCRTISLNPAYQPATFGVFILSFSLFVYRRDVLAIIFVILSASIHPTYIIQAF